MNVCGFHITEFFNEKHPMPDTPDDFVGDGNEGMFAFKKQCVYEISACRTEKHCNDMCKTKYKTPH